MSSLVDFELEGASSSDTVSLRTDIFDVDDLTTLTMTAEDIKQEIDDESGNETDVSCPNGSVGDCSTTEHKTVRKKSSHVCKICNEMFESLADVRLHRRQVHRGNEADLSCHTCSKTFTTLNRLKQHIVKFHRDDDNEEEVKEDYNTDDDEVDAENCREIRTRRRPKLKLEHASNGAVEPAENSRHRNNKLYCCTKCPKTFRTNSDLACHECEPDSPATKTKSKADKFTCSHCGRKFARAQELTYHERVHTGVKPFICFECGKRFHDIRPLRQHMTRHAVVGEGEPSPTLRFSCEECGKGYMKMASLKMHMKRHLGEWTHRCAYCSKVFVQKWNYVAHVRQHTGERPYGCSFCPKRFAMQAGAKRHERMSHPTTDDPKQFLCYQCSECDRAFRTRMNLRIHMLRHFGPVSFTCVVCDASFQHPSYLSEHMKRHAGATRFQCTRCGKAFYKKYDFQEHMNRHDGVRLHACDKCGMTFYTAKYLKRHQTIHVEGGGATTECPVCGKQLSVLNAANFRRHMMIHDNIRPFACSYCDKRFTQRVNLQSHERIHTGERPYPCVKCGKRFTQSSNLKNHMRHHPDVDMDAFGSIRLSSSTVSEASGPDQINDACLSAVLEAAKTVQASLAAGNSQHSSSSSCQQMNMPIIFSS